MPLPNAAQCLALTLLGALLCELEHRRKKYFDKRRLLHDTTEQKHFSSAPGVQICLSSELPSLEVGPHLGSGAFVSLSDSSVHMRKLCEHLTANACLPWQCPMVLDASRHPRCGLRHAPVHLLEGLQRWHMALHAGVCMQGCVMVAVFHNSCCNHSTQCRGVAPRVQALAFPCAGQRPPYAVAGALQCIPEPSS